MCGIAGLAGAGAADTAALHRMAGAMTHRGPDGEGVWHDHEVGLAFRRLAVIDLHERSNQPLHFGDLHLVFNGEIYNYVELRGDLRLLGHRFLTEGDAEVLLHAWAEWGESSLDRLNGMFALAVWDGAARRMTLATDRFAEKPLFVHERAGRLAFASDVRALRAADASIGIPDRDATDRFLALGTMPNLPATFFTDVRRVPPGHVGHWDGHRLELRRWWHPVRVDVPARPVDAAARLRELLADSVSLRLRSDVTVGTSLSGGVDSSAVVALSSELTGAHPRHAFTATFPGFARDEWMYASAVAATAGVAEHHAVRPGLDEMLGDLDRFVATQEEPFGSTSIYAQWRVMRSARASGVVVMLDGQGADELFGGYLGIPGWALRSRGPRAALAAVARDRRLAGPVAVAYWAHRAPRSIAVRYRLRSASPYVSPALAAAAARHEHGPPDWEESGSPVRRELLTQAFRTSLPHLCRFADRNSMAFGVEVRLPFLDPRVAEFAWSLPAGMSYRHGVAKWILREAVRGLVPAVVLDRSDKVGFETPEAAWWGSPTGRSRVAEILLDGGGASGIDRASVERDLAAGTWRDVGAVWRAVNVELWLRAARLSPTFAQAART